MSPFTYVLVCHCWMSSYLAIPIQGDVQNTLSSRFFSDLAHFFKRTTVNVILSGDLSDSDEELTFSAFMGSSSLFWLKFIPFSISHNHNFLALDGRNPPALCVFLPDVMQTQDSEWFKLSPSHIYLMPSNIPDWVLPKLNHQVFNYNVKNDGSVFLSETYYLKGVKKVTREIGFWKNESKLVVFEPILWERRSNLENILLVDVLMAYPPFTYVVHNNKTERLESTGLTADIRENLRSILNFTVTIVKPSDGVWGTIEENGTHRGMFAELYRGKADLSSSALVGTSERLAVVDFTIPMGHYYVGLVGLGSSQSDNPEMSPDSFFVIFTPWSWFATLLGACLLAIVLSFIMASVGNETQCLIQSTGQILLLFGKLGIVPATPKVCVRILFITGAVATYLLYEFYMATLTSYISVADPPKTITQLQDVLKLKYNLVTWGDSLLEQAFSEASKGTVFQKIFDEQLRGHPEKVLGNPSDIVQSIVKAPKTVYYGSILDVMEADHKQQLRTISIEEGYWLNQYFLCLPKDSELRDVFSYHMNKMKESGLVARLYRKWFPSLFKVEFVESTGDSSPISMVGVSYVYLIFGTICFFSILICFMECALKKIKK